MNDITSITRYFRQSLIDSERICPDDKSVLGALGVGTGHDKAKKQKGELLNVRQSCWSAGYFIEEDTQRIFKALERVHGKPRRYEHEEIVLFPRIDLLKSEGGKRNVFKRKVLIPIVVFAYVDRDGHLKPTDKQPWIPRIWLSPNEGQNSPIGDYEALDEYLTINPFEAVDSWPLLQTYVEGMIESVVGKSGVNRI